MHVGRFLNAAHGLLVRSTRLSTPGLVAQQPTAGPPNRPGAALAFRPLGLISAQQPVGRRWPSDLIRRLSGLLAGTKPAPGRHPLETLGHFFSSPFPAPSLEQLAATALAAADAGEEGGAAATPSPVRALNRG